MLAIVKQRFIDIITGEQREVGTEFATNDKARMDDLVKRNLVELVEAEPKAKASTKKKTKE